MTESVRNICRVTNDDHVWSEGLDGEVSCARCHECPNTLDELIEKDRLARLVDSLRSVPQSSVDGEKP